LVAREPLPVCSSEIPDNEPKIRERRPLSIKRIAAYTVIPLACFALLSSFVHRSTPVVWRSSDHIPTADDIGERAWGYVIFNPFRSRDVETEGWWYVDKVAAGRAGGLAMADCRFDYSRDQWCARNNMWRAQIEAEQRPVDWELIDRFEQGTSATLYYAVKCRQSPVKHFVKGQEIQDQKVGLGIVSLEKKNDKWIPVGWDFTEYRPKPSW